MKRLSALLFCIGFSFLTIPQQMNAQTSYGWEIGFWGGLSSYYGDLNPVFSFRRLGPTAGVFARKNFDGRFCLRFGGSWGNVGGNDATSPNAFEQARNLNFNSNVFEGAVVLEFNFQNFHSRRPREDKPVSPYLLAGFGITHFNPKSEYKGGNYFLRDLGTEGQARGEEYALVTPAMIAGFGLKIDMNPSWSWNIEISNRFTFTDYLDDVSGTYADYRTVAGYHGDAAGGLSDRSLEVGDVRIGERGRQRGNAKNKDMYIFASIGLAYRFVSVGCPAY